MDHWDKDVLTEQQIAERFKGFEDVNTGDQTVTFVIHNAYNNIHVRASLHASGYKVVEQIIVHKMNKTVQPFRVGHIPAHLTCHLATKTAEIWSTAVQKAEGKDRQSVWQTDYSPQHQKDNSGNVINRCLQSPDLVKRVVNLFPTECFSVKKVLIFSSGESCGWVAPLALEMGFNCICTEPDPRQYEALVSRLYEGLPAATAKLRSIREKSELKDKESQVDKTRTSFASGASLGGAETVPGSWDVARRGCIESGTICLEPGTGGRKREKE